MTTHISKQCMVKDCTAEATYWIATTRGFCESLLGTALSETFYLCIDHQYDLNGNDINDGGYVHLRVDTGELYWIEMGVYACSPDCDVCRD
jgi:hypothetical protein